MRRLFALAGAMGVAAALVLLIDAPPRRTGEESITGPRLFTMPVHAIERVRVAIGERSVVAERVGGRWTVDGRAASPPLDEALADLLQTLTTLRAVDRFRPRDDARFGFEPPRATIELANARRHTRVVLGELNAARSAVYARREDAPQVWLVGLYLVSALERVIYFASIEASPSAAPAPATAG